MFNILWIDDQYNNGEMIQFSIEADSEGLMLEGYPSFEEGFEALEGNLEHFDAILLDGLFFEKKGQKVGTEDESGIGMAIAKINELKSKKVFPWFVLSGKDKFTKGENSLLKANRAHCFDKTNPSDVVKLFKVIKAAASQQIDTQLKHKFKDLIDVCSDSLLGTEHFPRLFSIIKNLENLQNLPNTEDLLLPIRKIIERIFTRMAEKGIIPDSIIANNGWINGSGLFLANKHLDYEHLSEIAPSLISENIHRLLNIIQDGSHGEGQLKLKVDKYLKSAKSDYFYRSCVFLLFDLLLWFKDFMIDNSDIVANKARWKSKLNNGDWIKGTITLIAENGYGTFKPDNASATISIPPNIVIKNGLNQYDAIKVITKPSPDGSRTFIKEISKEI